MFQYDGILILTYPFQGSIGKIQEIFFIFKGSGSVDWVKLYDGDNNIVFEDDFLE